MKTIRVKKDKPHQKTPVGSAVDDVYGNTDPKKGASAYDELQQQARLALARRPPLRPFGDR